MAPGEVTLALTLSRARKGTTSRRIRRVRGGDRILLSDKIGVRRRVS